MLVVVSQTQEGVWPFALCSCLLGVWQGGFCHRGTAGGTLWSAGWTPSGAVPVCAQDHQRRGRGSEWGWPPGSPSCFGYCSFVVGTESREWLFWFVLSPSCFGSLVSLEIPYELQDRFFSVYFKEKALLRFRQGLHWIPKLLWVVLTLAIFSLLIHEHRLSFHFFILFVNFFHQCSVVFVADIFHLPAYVHFT